MSEVGSGPDPGPNLHFLIIFSWIVIYPHSRSVPYQHATTFLLPYHPILCTIVHCPQRRLLKVSDRGFSKLFKVWDRPQHFMDSASEKGHAPPWHCRASQLMIPGPVCVWEILFPVYIWRILGPVSMWEILCLVWVWEILGPVWDRGIFCLVWVWEIPSSVCSVCVRKVESSRPDTARHFGHPPSLT